MQSNPILHQTGIEIWPFLLAAALAVAGCSHAPPAKSSQSHVSCPELIGDWRIDIPATEACELNEILPRQELELFISRYKHEGFEYFADGRCTYKGQHSLGSKNRYYSVVRQDGQSVSVRVRMREVESGISSQLELRILSTDHIAQLYDAGCGFWAVFRRVK